MIEFLLSIFFCKMKIILEEKNFSNFRSKILEYFIEKKDELNILRELKDYFEKIKGVKNESEDYYLLFILIIKKKFIKNKYINEFLKVKIEIFIKEEAVILIFYKISFHKIFY
jgi:hypothetical protein